jgi:hypothetical protein
MTDPVARKPRRRFARGQSRPSYLDPADVDQVMIMLVALMSEVSALRDRIDTHEAVADLGGTATTAAIEAYELTPERAAVRETNRLAMLKRVLRVVTEERDAAATDGPAKRAPRATLPDEPLDLDTHAHLAADA